MKPCSRCGVDTDTWGRMHVCRSRVDPEPAAKVTELQTSASPTNPVMANKVANNDVANSAHMANASSTYRYRNIEKRRTYQRNLMRRKRAERTVTPS